MSHPHSGAVDLIGDWRGDHLENVHRGHAVIVGADGDIEQAWGDPSAVIFPRSACKMIQALPLVESGAADSLGLTDRQLALACASHRGADMHVTAVRDWLGTLGLGEDDLICGPHEPYDPDARDALIRDGAQPCRLHNNCSGKHTGFLTLAGHLGAGRDYVDPAHPVQTAVRAATEELAQETTPTFGIDGCSAPNFAVSVHGLARAGAFFATAQTRSDTRSRAAARLALAMRTYPDMVNGDGGACTALMRAMNGHTTVKYGADGVYLAILPDQRKAIAAKIADGSPRAVESVMTTLLVRCGALDPNHPTARKLGAPDIVNAAGVTVGRVRPFETLT